MYTTITVRLSADALEDITNLAEEKYIPARTLLRQWLMERLRKEKMERSAAASD